MGADITFVKGKEEFYFRDSYNCSNLAWVVGLSYWVSAKAQLKTKKKFFETLSKITDEEIDAYMASAKFQDAAGVLTEEYKQELKEFFKEQIKSINDNLNFIMGADKVDWFV